MATKKKSSRDDPFTRAYLEGMPDSLEGTPVARRSGQRPKTLPQEAIALARDYRRASALVRYVIFDRGGHTLRSRGGC